MEVYSKVIQRNRLIESLPLPERLGSVIFSILA